MTNMPITRIYDEEALENLQVSPATRFWALKACRREPPVSTDLRPTFTSLGGQLGQRALSIPFHILTIRSSCRDERRCDSPV